MDATRLSRQRNRQSDDLPSIWRELPAVVFVNPTARAGRAGRYLPAIREVFGSHRIPAEFLITGSAQSLESRARGAIHDGRRLLFAMGGDGTLQALANAAFGSDVLLGVLPVGGGNDFARALGLPRDPIGAALATLRGTPRFVDLLRARTADNCERLYCGGGGLGLDVDAARHAAETYHRLPGRFRYLAGLLRAFWGFTPVQVHAEFPGGDCAPIEKEVLIAAAFNTPSYGSGVRLAPDAKADDGLLELVFVENLSLPKVLAALPGLIRNGTLSDSHVQRARARCVILSADRRCLFHGDGEVFGPAPIRIEVLPGAARILAPAI